MSEKRPPRQGSLNFERDLAIAKCVTPVDVGGEGLTSKEAAERFKLSRGRVSQILKEPDIAEVRKAWQKDMMAARREHGAEFLAAEKELLEQREVRMVIAYGSQMGLSEEPALGIHVETLNVMMPEETRRLLAHSPIIDQLPEDTNAVERPEPAPPEEDESS